MSSKYLIDATHVESGSFQSGEEDCYNADIKRGDDVVIMKFATMNKIRGLLETIRDRSSASGDCFEELCAIDALKMLEIV